MAKAADMKTVELKNAPKQHGTIYMPTVGLGKTKDLEFSDLSFSFFFQWKKKN